MKRRKKISRRNSNSGKARKFRRKSRVYTPKTAKQYFSLSQKDQETWDSIGHVISRIKEGVPLHKAAKEFGRDPDTVIRLGRDALRKQKNGRYVAKKTDRLLRVVNVLRARGRKDIATRDSREASTIGGHWAAVQRYLQTGDDSALRKFHNRRVTDASGKRHLLLTDLKEIDRLGSAGVLSFESLYAGSR